MLAETFERACEALKSSTRLMNEFHMPRVFVVKDKIFVQREAALSWRDEVCPNELIEIVTIHKAYGLKETQLLPKKVKVDWNFNK